MGSKKRGISSIEDDVVAIEGEELVEKPESKRKMSKEKKGNEEEKEEIPMEKKKKRKMLDKERRRVESQSSEIKPSLAVVSSVASMEVDGGGISVGSEQPVFHINVFSELASADSGKRKAAAERLAVELMEVQRAFDKVGDKGENQAGLKLEAEKNDGLENCAESVRYAVRRLVRGVSSSRECARQGFALGLTILLSTNLKIRLDSVLKLVDDLLEVTSSMKGQEARDVLLGRLFAYGALARSRRLKEEWASDRNTPLVKEFTSHLITRLASKKRYLQEPAVAVLWDLIEMLPKEAVVSHILSAPGVREWFNGATDPGNPDALLLALRIREKIATDSDFGPLLPRPFSLSKVFTVEHLMSIANCLKESTFCQPRVHDIWPLLVNMLLPDTVLQDANVTSSLGSTKKHKKSRRASSSDEDSEGNLKIFIEVVVEGTLLTGSHDRKHLVFDVLLLMLPRLPASHVPIVFPLKFVQCLMDVLSTKDSWLHKVANNFLTKLFDWVGSDDIRRTFVIMALQKHSGGRFDSITRTKTVKELMAGFTTESGCMLFMQKLISIFNDEDPILDGPSNKDQAMDEESELVPAQDNEVSDSLSKFDILKNWVVESLPGLPKYVMDLEAKVKVQKEVMKFLAVQGLFFASHGPEVTSFELEETFRWPKMPISSALSKKCVDQVQLLLSNAQKAEGSHTLTNGLETNDLGCYFMRFLGTVCTIPSVFLVRPLSNEDEKTFKMVLDMEARLSREERNCGLSAGANKVHALRYLLIQLLLQLLLRPGEFTEAASELLICCQKAFPSTDDLESSGEHVSENGESSPVLMDVLVDTLLSLLPQSSAPLRSAVEQVFRYICEDITDDGLRRMLRVVKKDLKPPRHKDALSEDSDDDSDDLLELEDLEESHEAGKADADNSRDADQAASSDDEDISDADEDDEDDDDDDDDDMDDEAMFKFDALVSKIFQERKNKTGADSPHAQLVLFKLRILSLLEIYLHENPGSTRVLTAYSNLVQAFVNPSSTEGSEQLAQRISGILQKKIFKAKDYPKGEDVQLSILETLLEKSLRLASRPLKTKRSITKAPQKKQTVTRNRFKMINSLAQQSTHWILKIIDGRKFPEAELGKVFDIFKGVIENYFNKKKSQLKPEFLKEVIKRRPWVGQHLFGFILEQCGDAKSEYRRVGALNLVQELFKLITPDVSKKMLKPHLSKLSHLVLQLAAHMPGKQARRAEVKKFSGKVFQIVSTHNLAKSFLKTLEPDALALCESQFGETFLALKKTSK